MTAIGAVLAGLLGGTLTILERFASSRKPPSWRASGYLLLIFGIDGGSSLLAYAVLVTIFKGLTWYNGPWPVLIAGLCGPAVLRSQLALLGSGLESSYHGPAVRYQRIRAAIERRIDQIGADAQSSWVSDAMPMVLKLPVDDFVLRVTTFVKSLERMSAGTREQVLSYIDETMLDGNLDDLAKRRAVVQKLWDSDCRQCVKGLKRSARKL